MVNPREARREVYVGIVRQNILFRENGLRGRGGTLCDLREERGHHCITYNITHEPRVVTVKL
jgi:hypothetical protein